MINFSGINYLHIVHLSHIRECVLLLYHSNNGIKILQGWGMGEVCFIKIINFSDC